MSIWFITGASRGFGKAVALEALNRGDKVVATARNVHDLNFLKAFPADSVCTLPLDVTDTAQVEKTVEEALAYFGSVDILFNNAGIGYFAAVEESDEHEVRKMLDINLFGLASVTNELLPHFRQKRSGTILNVSSVGGVRSFPAVGWYNASKFAVEGLSEALSFEVTPLGIRVILLEPSAFATDWAGNSAAEVIPRKVIADYEPTAGAQRKAFREGAGKEPGDPERAAVAIVDIAHDSHPPLRLPLGNYAYDGLLEKLGTVREDVAVREAISRSADRPEQ